MRLLAVLFAVVLTAQPSTGSITGVAADVRGDLLPGTRVIVTAPGIERSAVTDERGQFAITGLPPGRYALVARLVGFESASQGDLELRAGGTVKSRLTLKVGCLEHVDYVDPEFKWALQHTDAVAHIRAPARTAAALWSRIATARRTACARCR